MNGGPGGPEGVSLPGRVRRSWSRLPRLVKAVLVLAIAGLVVAGALGVPGLFTSKPAYRIIQFDTERAYADHEWFQELGPRMTGSDAELRGAEYIVGQLQEAGLKDVHIERYDCSLFEVVRAGVSMVSYGPGGILPRPLGSPVTFEHTVDFVVQGFSGSLAWGSFRDDLSVHDLGNGTDNASWAAASGMCGVMWNDEWTQSNTQLFRKAKENGLAALAVQNRMGVPETDYAPIFKGVYFEEGESYPEIPFFEMSKRMGEEVMSAARGGSRIRLDFDVPKTTVELRVVVGDVPGTEQSSGYVLLGAHMDTVYNGPGQVDNTSGTVTILETARNIVKERPKRTIRFAWFGGEEVGILGSQAYVNAHSEDIGKNLMFMQNCDMTNIDISRGLRGFIGSNDNASVAHYQALARQVQASDERFAKYSLTIIWDPMREGSDQAPFAQAGKKVCFSAGSGCREYHTYLDDISHVNTESEALFGKILGGYALYLAETG